MSKKHELKYSVLHERKRFILPVKTKRENLFLGGGFFVFLTEVEMTVISILGSKTRLCCTV